MENESDFDILLIRLFSGEACSDEKKLIADWLNQSTENKKLYSDLREIWLSSGIQTNADDYHVEEAIRKFSEHIHKNQEIQKRTIKFGNILKYAAIVLLALGLPVSYYMGKQSFSPDRSLTTISCAYGDKSDIILPDSSRVFLNSGSKLVFYSNFREGRKVTLEGEAFFEVSKDKKHPFQVKTKDIEIEVLGTKFNLKAYSDEKSISTTLIEGSVKISGQFEQILMKPNQKLIFDKKSKTTTMQKLTDTSIETGWKEGRLVFRNESLAELEPKLERWFDVDIVFGDEQVKNRRFTGVLNRESILEAISFFNQSNYVSCTIRGNKIYINSKTTKIFKNS
jgi:transmembrane sensor